MAKDDDMYYYMKMQKTLQKYLEGTNKTLQKYLGSTNKTSFTNLINIVIVASFLIL